ncbi:MAG: hypothetical protein J5605_10015 [Bacteroidales bacterium]|nr:hypothetical protein [Bacteroidales bacterium]
MKKLIIICFLLPIFVLAQKPAWVDANSRNLNYPTNRYKTGFKSDNMLRGETAGEAKSRMERGARENLMATIQVSLQSVSVDKLHSYQYTDGYGEIDETLNMEFQSVTVTQVDMQDVPGIIVESWIDNASNEVYGFAYVSVSSLKTHFSEKINLTLARAESVIDNINTLVEYGNKIKAREKAKDAIPMFATVEYAQRMLVALDNSGGVRDLLQTDRTYRLKNSIAQLVASLSHATSICLQCRATTVGGKQYPTLANTIKGRLSEMGCNFVSDPSQADWVVNIEASVTKVLNPGMAFAYVNGSVSLTNKATGQTVYEETISSIESGHTADGIKGGGTTATAATSEAYKNVARIVGNKILEIIKK